MNKRPLALLAPVLVFAGISLIVDGALAQGAPPALVTTAPKASGPVDSIVWNLPFGEPGLIDPPNTGSYSGSFVASNLCDSLLTVNESLEVQPNIVDYKIISPKQIVYTLKEGAKFWDGAPVTAEDVVFSLRRSAAPEQLVSFIYANVSSIEVTGPMEVTVNFKEPDSLFNNEMANFAGMVMEKAYTEKAGKTVGTAAGGIMCSGPFKLVEWMAGDHIKIARNDTYWNKARLPLAGEIKFTFVTDSDAYIQAMKAGEIDGSYEISPSAIQALSGAESGNLYLGPSTQFVTLSVAKPGGVMGDLGLRHALQKIIDRVAIAQSIYSGAAQPLFTHVTPLTWQQSAKNVYQAAYDEFAQRRAYDEIKASELVKGSKYAGEDIVMVIPAGDETLGLLGQYIQQQAKKAGLNLSIRALQPLEYAGLDYNSGNRLGFDLLLGVGYNAAQDPLEPVSIYYASGAFFNIDGFDNADVNRLIGTMRTTSDAAEKAKIFVEMQNIYEAEDGVVPVVAQDTVTFLNKRLAGAVTSFAYMSMPALVYVGAAK